MMNSTSKKVFSLKSSWYLWLFPLFAILISAWLFVEYYKQRGQTIQVAFEDASGIEAGKTNVRFRGVTIGSVKEITISEDSKEVIAHVLLKGDAEHFAVEGTKFWVVSPQVTFQGVSGLETLFKGTYIAALPGTPGGEVKTEFSGQLTNDADLLQGTTSYILETNQLGSVNAGDQVSFRGLTIGSVTKVSLSKTSQTLLVQINVQNKFVKLVRTNTVFWRKVGVQANLGLFKSEVKINSLDSLLRGGIDMFTPDGPGPIAKARAKFELLSEPPKDYEKWNPELKF